jgi:kynureninase
MEAQFQASAGASAWQISNPPVLAAAPLIAALQIFSEAGIGRLRAKSVALTGYLEELIRPLQPQVQVITPRASDERGCQLSVRIAGSPARSRRVFAALSTRGVVCDWRSPDIIRVAPVPLYNRFEDAWLFARALAEALAETT